jgi:hypothetical protein
MCDLLTELVHEPAKVRPDRLTVDVRLVAGTELLLLAT